MTAASTKPEIVVIGPMYSACEERLDREFIVHRLWQASDPARFLKDVAAGARGVTLFAPHGCPGSVIEALPQLEIIACMGAGVDKIDLDYAKARGVRVTNTPDVVTDDTADLALALMLATERRIAEADRFVRRFAWLKGDLPFGRALRHRKVGIVGLGRIGQAIATRCAAFGMQIAYFGPRCKADVAYAYFADPVALADWAEILIVAAPGGPETHNLVSRDVIDALGPEGTLINIARGTLVDETALVDALAEGRLGRAGLDVYVNEPHVPEALLTMDNVVLSPHTGSATHDTRRAMGDLTIDNLLAYFTGRPLLTPVI
ncbi:MAG TPA: 2-hydroxyacid dehydrogenase [Stellaceae bacterium]|nr:2-hydroxyacid dehydrogenase [Stellaceae bacterium]